MHTLDISNCLSEVRRMSLWLDAIARQLGLPEKLLFNIDLCANEAVTNIISYAYPENGMHKISLQLSSTDSSVILEIEDDGIPFNPLEFPPHVRPTSLEEAKIGGLGVHLIQSFMDECSYIRQNGRNILRMIAYLPHC